MTKPVDREHNTTQHTQHTRIADTRVIRHVTATHIAKAHGTHTDTHPRDNLARYPLATQRRDLGKYIFSGGSKSCTCTCAPSADLCFLRRPRYTCKMLSHESKHTDVEASWQSPMRSSNYAAHLSLRKNRKTSRPPGTMPTPNRTLSRRPGNSANKLSRRGDRINANEKKWGFRTSVGPRLHSNIA